MHHAPHPESGLRGHSGRHHRDDSGLRGEDSHEEGGYGGSEGDYARVEECE